jgi:hypothetical protein
MMRAARGWFVLFVAACLLAFAGPAAAQSKSPAPRVYLLRGLANVFSLGMDDLTAKLNARGIKATVHPYTEWQTLARYAVEQSAAGGKQMAPVIIIGHSLGADAAVYMANRVTELGAPVPLVVTFDPVTPTTASSKIGKVVNYYQAGGSGKPVSGARVSNIDLTNSGALTHLNIDKSANLHEQVIAMIVKGTPRPAVARKPKPKPVSTPAEAAGAATTTTGSIPATTASAPAAPEAAPPTPAAAAAPTAEAKPASPM